MNATSMTMAMGRYVNMMILGVAFPSLIDTSVMVLFVVF